MQVSLEVHKLLSRWLTASSEVARDIRRLCQAYGKGVQNMQETCSKSIQSSYRLVPEVTGVDCPFPSHQAHMQVETQILQQSMLRVLHCGEKSYLIIDYNSLMSTHEGSTTACL